MCAKKVASIAPYLSSLTEYVCNYLKNENINIVYSYSLSVDDNLKVSELEQDKLLEYVTLVPKDVDVIVISACVQMPSIDIISKAEKITGKRIISTSTATVYQLFKTLKINYVKTSTYGSLFSSPL